LNHAIIIKTSRDHGEGDRTKRTSLQKRVLTELNYAEK